MITVFTPTYNRAVLLPRLYESLCKQTYKDFEWIVVDDGSTDETSELIRNYELEVRGDEIMFPIQYFCQKNGGKHRAVNRGVKEARGELFFIADSDDRLPPTALADVAKVYAKIKDDASFAGVCGLDGTFDGHVIGSGLSKDSIDDSSIVIRYKLGVVGDMKEVFRTEVLKEFPFPEIVEEKFCPEVLVWNRIAIKYKLRYFNTVIYQVEYQSDGISSGIIRSRMKSPIASMMTYAEMTEYNIPFAQKVKAAVNYWRFRLCAKKNVKELIPRIAWWWYLCMPVGWGMHLNDLRVLK